MRARAALATGDEIPARLASGWSLYRSRDPGTDNVAQTLGFGVVEETGEFSRVPEHLRRCCCSFTSGCLSAAFVMASRILTLITAVFLLIHPWMVYNLPSERPPRT